MRDGVAVGVDDLRGRAAARAALRIEHDRREGRRVIRRAVERAHVGGIATERVVATFLREVVEVVERLGEDVGVHPGLLRQFLDGRRLDQLRLTLVVYEALFAEFGQLSLVEHEKRVSRGSGAAVHAAIIGVAMAMRLVFAQEAAAVVTGQEHAARPVQPACRRQGRALERVLHHDLRAVLALPGVAAQDAERFVAVHVPQVGAGLEAHAHAVALVVDAPERGEARCAQVVLLHERIVLEAAAGEDHAVEGADEHRLALFLDLDADDRLGLRLLDQMDGRRLEPHADGIGAVHDALAQLFPQSAVGGLIGDGEGGHRVARV